MEDVLQHAEKSLLKQVAKGDERAFTQLFHQWQPFLATHIFRITESEFITEEIVQDVFLKIWQSRETLAEINSFKAYLLVVSKNHALNVLRKLSNEFQKQEAFIKENRLHQDQESETAAKHYYYSLIDEAVSQLSPRQKEVYLLHRHEHLTYKQIAERLGIGTESVKTHFSLAVSSISSYVKAKLALTIIGLIIFY